MFQTPIDFLEIFVRPPGDLIYFLAIVAICLTSLLMAVGERLRSPHNRVSRRYALATGGAFLAWIVIMLGALFAILAEQDASAILPPLERASSVVMILLIGWVFLSADHDRWGRSANIILLLLLLVCAIGYVITGSAWTGIADQTDFNLSIYGIAWTFIPVVLSALGIVLVLVYFKLISDAPLKLIFFAVLLLGYGAALIQTMQGALFGNDVGVARLAFVAALPILPAILFRVVVNNLQGEIVPQSGAYWPEAAAPTETRDEAPPATTPEAGILPPSGVAPTLSPIQRDSVQLLRTLGLILEEATPADIPQRVITAGVEVLKADIGAVLTFQDANYADIIAAFDRVNQRPLNGVALNLENQPTLVNAVERQLQRPLFPDRNIEELRDLYNRLDVEVVGPTYFQPLLSGRELVAVLMIGLPYAGRELEETERELLKGIGIIAGNLLALSFAARDARQKAEERAIEALVKGVPLDQIADTDVLTARQELQASLQLSREQVKELSRQVMEMKVALDRERSRVSTALGDTEEGLSVSQRLLALNDEQQRLREERDQLAARLKEAETTLVGATASSDENVFKTMIEVLSREKAELVAQRDRLQAQLDEIRHSDRFAAPQMVQELIEHMSQEKAQLEVEHEQLRARLNDIEGQLRALGVENGAAGLLQMVGQLTEQRALLQAKLDSLTLERNALLNERRQLESRIEQEKEREARIEALQNEIKHLAADREAAIKYRDQLRGERDELAAKHDAIKQQRARLLAEASAFQIEAEESRQEQARLRSQLQQLADERSDLISLRDRLLAEKKALEIDRDQLLARLEGQRDRLQQLGEDGVGSLTRMIEEVTEQRNHLERELNESRTTIATLQNQISLLQSPAAGGDGDVIESKDYNPDIILSMVQEFRTPMTSIVGYIDLLLDEAAGILGEMQRKFLQRIAANVSRLTFMLDDVTRIAAIDNDRFTLTPEPLSIVDLIEEAITNSTHQFREKGLTVHLNLDDSIPKVRADRDAVSQIINELLTNAYLASPTDSQVYITAHRQQVKLSNNHNFSSAADSLLVSVEDRGGGIAAEDLPRVFARKYKAENPLIQGLGDTGVGLSIAKTLAEAHGGGLWLETRENVGSIFYFALPIIPVVETEG
ncbi:MAG: hypothetical protein HXY41_08135 [Chloroflexi bacterium]|nr:hypothetical protein [Chloroflexota bacterium]